MTNIFKASFRFYEAAAPYPGICLRCGTNGKLWELGTIRGTNMGAFYCDPCLIELADYAGLEKKTVHETAVAALEAEIATLKAMVDKTPELAKELIHDLNNLFGNFVTMLAVHASSPVPVQSETDPTDPAQSPSVDRVDEGTRKGKSEASQSSFKSSRK